MASCFEDPSCGDPSPLASSIHGRHPIGGFGDRVLAVQAVQAKVPAAEGVAGCAERNAAATGGERKFSGEIWLGCPELCVQGALCAGAKSHGWAHITSPTLRSVSDPRAS